VPDQVHQLARTHAKSCPAQARVDRRRLGEPFVQQRERLGVVRPGDPVDDEARRRARVHRRLAPALGELEDRRRRLRVGREAGDDLDELHQRHRIEEVHADEAARQAQLLGERGDRDRRRVRHEDRPRADDLLEVAKESALGVEALDDRLDDDAGLRGVLELRRGGDARSDRLRFGSVEPALGGEAVERRCELGARARRGAFAGVEQADRVPGLRRDLRDSRAHDSGADDEDRRVGTERVGHGAGSGRCRW
jgi:hypothetical protein